jgi:murein DD-endopeptidase MepM/ murein hydrolase activator NlpD
VAREGSQPVRDLGSVELWQRSLARSRQRRRLMEIGRRARRRRKRVSLAVSAALAAGPVVPQSIAATEPGAGADAAANTGPEDGLAATASSRLVLEPGSQGALVAALQGRLNEVLPFAHLDVDGIYGTLTRGAVVDFQRRHSLRPTGAVDTRTWASLFNAPVLVIGAATDTGVADPGVGPASAVTAAAATAGRHFASLPGAADAGATGPHVVAGADKADGGRPLAALAGSAGAMSDTSSQSSTPSAGHGPAGRTAAPASGGQSAPAGSGSASNAGASAGSAGLQPSTGAQSIAVVAPSAPSSQPSTYVLTDGVALPQPRQYVTNGYVDQGVDYAAPGGTPKYAMGDGVIIGEGISGFGPNAPILKIASGPLAGLQVYYGHAGPNLVHVGQQVTAGQQITEVGYGIVGISTGPHLEVGFYPPGSMGSGSRMLSVISSLLSQHPSGRVWSSATTAGDVSHTADATASRGAATQRLSTTSSSSSSRPPSASTQSAVRSGSVSGARLPRRHPRAAPLRGR